MALFTESQLRTIGQTQASYKRATAVLKEASDSAPATKIYDIFLSHAVLDAEIVLGIKVVLERNGHSVYVDWLEDGDLDRAKVTVATAERLRGRMRQSKSLIYAHSNNSPNSKWMPWELGYFDGFRSAISILPIAKTENESFRGQEFLGLYPYIDVSGASMFVNRGQTPASTIGEAAENFVTLKEWLRLKAGVAI
jgi:hypothetical protein